MFTILIHTNLSLRFIISFMKERDVYNQKCIKKKLYKHYLGKMVHVITKREVYTIIILSFGGILKQFTSNEYRKLKIFKLIIFLFIIHDIKIPTFSIREK